MLSPALMLMSERARCCVAKAERERRTPHRPRVPPPPHLLYVMRALSEALPSNPLRTLEFQNRGNGYEIERAASALSGWKHCRLWGFVVWAVDLSAAPDVSFVKVVLRRLSFELCPPPRGKNTSQYLHAHSSSTVIQIMTVIWIWSGHVNSCIWVLTFLE